MNRSELIRARVEPSVREAVDDYAAARGLNQSEAVRDLVRIGLKHQHDKPKRCKREHPALQCISCLTTFGVDQ